MSLRERLRALGGPFPRASGPADRAAGRLRRPLDRWIQARQGRLGDLAALGDDCGGAQPPAGPGPRVLVLALRGWPNHSAYVTTIAHALGLRGAHVALLTCGGGQPICEMGWARQAYPRPCDRCAWYTDELIGGARLPAYRLVDGFSWGRDGRRAPLDPVEVGAGSVDPEWGSQVSVPWFLKNTQLDGRPEAEAAAADYRAAVASVEQSARTVLEEFNPDIVLMLNGTFASERVVRELALERGARVVTYENAPSVDTLFFSQDVPACRYDTSDLWELMRSRPLTDAQRGQIADLLARRTRGKGAHERYFDAPEEDVAALRTTLDIADGQRVLSLFTNVAWDSAALGRNIGFPTMSDWVAEAVAIASRLDDTVLVVRVHPAEAKWTTNEDLERQLLARVGSMPPNLRVVAPHQPLSSYALLDMTDLALTYTSTVGLEASYRGVPVAVAATTHYRGRGFTWDIESAEQLKQVMAGNVSLSDEQREQVERYAYTFFFRALIPFTLAPTWRGSVRRVARTAEELRPGRDPYLDLICDRILDGEPFYIPDELAATRTA